MQSEPHDAQYASSPFEACWKSGIEHAKDTDRHLAQVTQKLTMAQAKLVHENSHLRAFRAAFRNARDAVVDQCSLAAHVCWFLDSALQKSTEDFFISIIDHSRVEGL